MGYKAQVHIVKDLGYGNSHYIAVLLGATRTAFATFLCSAVVL